MRTFKKSICVVAFVMFFLTSFTQHVFSQPTGTVITGVIEPCQIPISTVLTTNLVFPFPIIGVDRGSSDIAVQKADGADNILQVKAAVEDFKPTNLTVIIADGNLHSFILVFSQEPTNVNFRIGSSSPTSYVISEDYNNEAEINTMSSRVRKKIPMFRRLKDKSYGSAVALHGIYYANDVLFFQIQFENNTMIPYDTDDFRVFFKDRKKGKRTATQEIGLTPLHLDGDIYRIDGNTKNLIVFALKKFTIPDKKNLILQLAEKNGGRHLELSIKNKHLVKAQTIM